MRGPDTGPPPDAAGMHALGAEFWPLAMTRELDDLILDLRTNEPAHRHLDPADRRRR